MLSMWGPGMCSRPLTPSLGLEKDRGSHGPSVYQMGVWNGDPVGLGKSEQNSLIGSSKFQGR